ncbi:MAG: surface lipoprotein assembly modifier, partial [Pseudomonadota bacterium]
QRTAIVAILAASVTTTQVQAQTVSLSPGQVRALAVSTLQAGNPGDAALAADALLRRFPDDASTLLIRTEAALLLGDFAGATSFGQRAFWNAINDQQRFGAARLTALGHARQTQDNLAQIWLRVARQYATTEAASEAVAREFQIIRRRNPLSVNLRFGVTPSTNINGGSSNEQSALFGLVDANGNPLLFNLSEDAQALSGWEYSGSLNLRYRARTDDTSATFLDFGLSGRTYTLTEGSERRANEGGGDVQGSDFSDATLSLGVTHRFVLAPDANVTEVGLNYSRTFQRDTNERHFATASISHAWDIGETDSLRLSSFYQRQRRIENGDEVQVFDIGATYSTLIEGVGAFSFGVGARDNLAQDEAEDFDSVRYRVGFSPEQSFEGVNFGFSLSYEERDFDNVPIIAGPRFDEITSFGVRAVLTNVEYFGFQPVITFDRTRQESNSNLFDRNFTEIGFDIVSSF